MSAFITRRGGATSAPSTGGGNLEEVITGKFSASNTTAGITIPDLIGKSRFVIDATHTGSGTAVIVFIRYVDGDILEYDKSTANISEKKYTADSDQSLAYFDPATGTLNPYAVSGVRWCGGEYYEYTYTIYG